ncbi:insulin-like growth factor-binding protein complex acid labile subunit [Uranotaenia lowii]|uniref:insulin-like growth factor-binding protein complex acid labile subunit n=1 Tax=Uranotaenia lowii TaxID=190385 RepID=UPI00247ADA5C|nr:insulin-like growth factor-binding protein complex acid labile subunit [Uranotaenia lowii]
MRMNFMWRLLFVIRFVTFVTAELPCPSECHCGYRGLDYFADCSENGLTELPEFTDYDVQILILSKNLFSFIPPEISLFTNLRYLDMSNNLITSLPADSLDGLLSLKQLDLAFNNISSWANIYPNELLLKTSYLEEFSLAGNQFTSFSSNEASLVLISPSLRFLDLSDCKISKVSGREVIQGLPSLEHLALNNNPLKSIQADIESTSLKRLDLSGCRLISLPSNVFSSLTSLQVLNLSRNYKISLFLHGTVTSDSLRHIDLSNCIMDSIDLEGFPNLRTAILRGNLIRQLTRDSFAANPLLEKIDLSSNSIKQVPNDAFKRLAQLKILDLSFNTISQIDGKTFKDNVLLTTINLSRNYISRMQRIVATSLAHLNMSYCEIMYMDADALGQMPALIGLDLSHNLLSELPTDLQSDTLQTLDLSMCRISSVDNETFAKLPSLLRLNLYGNRLTNPFRQDYFDNNTYLGEIWLGDNPWRCDCRSHDFRHFFVFLTEPPGRINDRKQLRCTSPEDVAGYTWDTACRMIWHPAESMGTTERIWTYFMLAILAFFGFFCLYSSVKRFIDSRRKMEAERQRRENIDHLREVTRQNNMRLQQEAQCNAPDVRESRPPCYEDAILLPKLDAASFASLDELVLRGKRKKRRKQRQSTSDEPQNTEDDEPVELRSASRSRSENVLSMRATVYQEPSDTVVPRSPIYQRPMSNRPVVATVAANVHASPTESRTSGTLQQSSPTGEELHYHSTDILGIAHTSLSPTSSRSTSIQQARDLGPGQSFEQIQNFNERSYENSPYAKRKVKALQHINPNGSLEEITDFEEYDTSPYAKRRIKHMSSFKGKNKPPIPFRPPPVVARMLSQSDSEDEEIRVVDDYFRQPKRQSLNSDEFTVLTQEDVGRTSVAPDSNRSVDISAGSSIEVIPANAGK